MVSIDETEVSIKCLNQIDGLAKTKLILRKIEMKKRENNRQNRK